MEGKGPASTSEKDVAVGGDVGDTLEIQRFLWNLSSIGLKSERLENIWPSKLGVSRQQWMLLLALLELNEGGGATIAQIADALSVNPSFIAAQSKALAKLGFLVRQPDSVSANSALSLSARFQELFHSLSLRRARLYSSVFTGTDIGELNTMLVELDGKLEKALTSVEMGADR